MVSLERTVRNLMKIVKMLFISDAYLVVWLLEEFGLLVTNGDWITPLRKILDKYSDFNAELSGIHCR